MSDDDKFPSQLAERFQVRLPDGMRDRIAEAAKANNRSMNAEIVARLLGSFDTDDLDARMTRIEQSLEAMQVKISQINEEDSPA